MRNIFMPTVCNLALMTVTSVFLICGTQASAEQSLYPARITSTSQAQDQIGIDRVDNATYFGDLAAEWASERGASSSIAEITTTPAYLAIMAMGKEAMPFILERLKAEGDNPDHWFVALHYISRQDPVPDEDRGDMAQMAKAWLNWAERNDGR